MTPVTVGELNTSVQTEEPAAAAQPGTAPAGVPWEELERVRRGEAELARLRARTRAEGFE